ncbi:hypothetical protein, partial [Salmonella enterica]|uniref:hypothetical protein n=1 Tax=Salmonella enterica TaxID=28901 RepID=UPI001F1C7EAC
RQFFSTYRIGTEASANPVCGELPVPLTVVTGNLGSHRGSFTGRNTGSGTLFVYASGGNGGSAGGDCANTSRLQGYVAGVLISTNASNNPSYGKTAFISFAVPAGATYQITSYPAQNYSCGSGVFSVFGYQT